MNHDLQQVKDMAVQLLDDHGLLSRGWHFEWSNRVKAKGDCHYGYKRIRLSRHFAKSRPLDGSRDTVIHEIAHALVGQGHGHGSVWKTQMRALGANDTTYTTMAAEHQPCHENTGEIFSRYQRKPTGRKWYSMGTLFIRGRRAETEGKLCWMTWAYHCIQFGEPA